MFDQRTIENLNYYVYILINPETDEPFYVGKGKDNRVFAHVSSALESETKNDEHFEIENEKFKEIIKINKKGLQVKHLIVRHGLTEHVAFEIESALIDTFKYLSRFKYFESTILRNQQLGIRSIEKGLMSSDEVMRLYNAEELNEINEDCIIININSSYKRGSGEDAIYQATKDTWDITEKRRKKINYVLSEYRGLIVEVFKVNGEWYEKERGYGEKAKKFGELKKGYGFDGEVAIDSIRDLYVNKSISGRKPRGFAGVIIFPDTLKKWSIVK